MIINSDENQQKDNSDVKQDAEMASSTEGPGESNASSGDKKKKRKKKKKKKGGNGGGEPAAAAAGETYLDPSDESIQI